MIASLLFSTENETPKAYADACYKLKLFTDRPAIVVHPDHPWAKKDSILPEELSGQPLIWPRVNHGLKDLFIKEYAARFLPSPVLSIQNLDHAYVAIKRNLGTALMTIHSQNLVTKDLCFIPVDLPNCKWNQMLYWKKDLVLSPEDECFLSYVKDYYAES